MQDGERGQGGGQEGTTGNRQIDVQARDEATWSGCGRAVGKMLATMLPNRATPTVLPTWRAAFRAPPAIPDCAGTVAGLAVNIEPPKPEQPVSMSAEGALVVNDQDRQGHRPIMDARGSAHGRARTTIHADPLGRARTPHTGPPGPGPRAYGTQMQVSGRDPPDVARPVPLPHDEVLETCASPYSAGRIRAQRCASKPVRLRSRVPDGAVGAMRRGSRTRQRSDVPWPAEPDGGSGDGASPDGSASG